MISPEEAEAEADWFDRLPPPRPYPATLGLAAELTLVALGVLALAVLVGVGWATLIEWVAGLFR
jgi:hypothetical protein